MSQQARPRILLLYYSHSGDAGRVAEELAGPLRAPEVDLTVERLRPIVDYPYPWRSIRRFFGILPECHLGPWPALEPLRVEPTQKFDLVILVYQVWFLAPSLPVQSFFHSDAARLLRGVKVMTVSVSRNMWHSASETMKRLLREAGARHIDHVSITHQGPAWATFVTTPRSLLFGKKEGFWGIFPPAGISAADLAGIARFSRAILNQRDKLMKGDDAPLLRGLGAVQVNPRYVVPELIGWYWFRGWARLIRALGRMGSVPRLAGVYLFVVCLVMMILVVLPVTLLVRLLLYPCVRRWTAVYVHRLEQPSGP
jgi:hypothetical protein